MIPFQQVKALTFDCYGTLIDWEAGISEALDSLLRQRGAKPFSDGELLEAYAESESRIEAGPYVPYRTVLAHVTREMAARFGAELSTGDESRLAESIRDWPPFADTAGALDRLSRRFQLIILSNIDRDLFELSRPRLGALFAHVITAEDVGAYKPAPDHFHEALARTKLRPAQVCHVAQSLFHDIAVAARRGFHTIWINRRGSKPGSGATPAAAAKADLELPDLKSLAAMV